MATYETIFITPPNLADADERTTVESMAQIVVDGGGELIANERMGRRRLAYPIRRFDDGVYMRFLYDADAEVPRELERRFRLSDSVLRSLTVRLDREWAVSAKEQAVRDAQRRAEEAAAEEAAAAAAAEAEAAKPPAEEAQQAAPTTDEAAGKTETAAAEAPRAAETNEPAAERPASDDADRQTKAADD